MLDGLVVHGPASPARAVLNAETPVSFTEATVIEGSRSRGFLNTISLRLSADGPLPSGEARAWC